MVDSGPARRIGAVVALATQYRKIPEQKYNSRVNWAQILSQDLQ
jgi:hypothetical protein